MFILCDKRQKRLGKRMNMRLLFHTAYLFQHAQKKKLIPDSPAHNTHDWRIF
jgi:hypothetical protein